MKRKKHFRDTFLYRHFLSAFVHPKNFFLCLRYPFWRIDDHSGRFAGYGATWYDDIPDGWRKAFGEKLSADIAAALKADGLPRREWREAVGWEQIKEKFGSLRLYAATTEKVHAVLDRYEAVSVCYCIACGKPARYRTEGWIEYYCEDCISEIANRQYSDGEYVYPAEFRNGYLESCRLKRADLTDEACDEYIKRYGVDLAKLWGIE